MSDVKKITDEQLKDLQGKVGAIQNLQSQIGGIEAQKHVALHQLLQVQDDLQKLQVTLQDEYGKINVNIQDGTYEEVVEEAVVEEA